MFKNVRSNFKKIGLTVLGVGAGVMGTVLPALAVGTADTTVTTALQTTSDNSIATIGGIAPIALAIFAPIFIWRLGIRLFKMLAKA